MKTRPYATPPREYDAPGYPTDLSDAEYAVIAPLVAQPSGSGRKREVDTREILNAIFYRLRTGCQWRMMPKDLPYWGQVSNYYYRWKQNGTWERVNDALRRAVRQQAGRDPEPSVGVIDSQSVPTTEMGGERGFNPHKHIKGRKRNILVDTMGLILYVVVMSASFPDNEGAEYIINETHGKFPRLKRILVDNGYTATLASWAKSLYDLVIDIVKRPREKREFTPQPQRWKVERTFGWLNWERLLSKEYERTITSSECDVYIASIRLLLRRLTSSPK